MDAKTINDLAVDLNTEAMPHWHRKSDRSRWLLTQTLVSEACVLWLGRMRSGKRSPEENLFFGVIARAVHDAVGLGYPMSEEVQQSARNFLRSGDVWVFCQLCGLDIEDLNEALAMFFDWWDTTL